LTDAQKVELGRIFQCFVGLHKPPRERPNHFAVGGERFTVSQIQHIPAMIRQIMKNCEDMEAEMLLGKLIAGEIDIYRLLRETYKYYDSDVRTLIHG